MNEKKTGSNNFALGYPWGNTYLWLTYFREKGFCFVLFFQTAKLNHELEVRADQNSNSNIKMVSFKKCSNCKTISVMFPFWDCNIIAHLSNDAIRQTSVINLFL